MRTENRLAWLGACVALAAACSDPPQAVPDKLHLEPAKLDFGFAPPNALIEKPFVVVNDGNVAVAISAVEIVGDKRQTFTVTQKPDRLLPGERGAISVQYRAPADPGEDAATLKVANTSEQSPTLEGALAARTSEPSCTDKVRNGSEGDVDCGGDCAGCAAGKSCVQARDCAVGLGCVAGKCGSCTSDAECSAGALCSNGACAGCREDADCPSGNTCNAGKCEACPGATGRIDTKTDAANCGKCGNICPAALNAPASCHAGTCGRGACANGYFDIDGDATFGCEATCVGKTCTAKDGSTITLTAEPIGERHRPLGTHNGQSFGSEVQTSASHTNSGVIGESPAPSGGAVQQSTHYRNQGGFSPALR